MRDDPNAPARAVELSRWVETMSRRVLEQGVASALGGDPAWDALLAELGVTPLPPAERQRHLKEGARRSRGALPIEVRWAIERIEKSARAWLWEIDKAMPTEHGDQYIRPVEHQLQGLVDETVRQHLAQTALVANTTASIFANARASTPNYSAMGAKAGIEETKCKTCGGPRRHTGDLGPCDYCGAQLG
jgi:hypothetical protein